MYGYMNDRRVVWNRTLEQVGLGLSIKMAQVLATELPSYNES